MKRETMMMRAKARTAAVFAAAIAAGIIAGAGWNILPAQEAPKATTGAAGQPATQATGGQLASQPTTAPVPAKGRLVVNTPGPGMRFTAGLTVQVWGQFQNRDDQQGWPQAECYWDGQLVDQRVLGNLKGFSYFPFTVPAARVTPGDHTLTLRGFLRGAKAPIETSVTVPVDPWPADKKVVELAEDMTAADLDWTNVAVRGNGHTVKVSGKLTIVNSLVSGLGCLKIGDPSNDDPAKAVMVAGIKGTLTGDVTIKDSIFEATGALDLAINGDGAVSIRNNEFRASNYIKFVPSNPEASPVILISGNNARHKLFQGNRVGSGRVIFQGMKDWLIGSDTDRNEADGNILMGPRCTINALGCNKVVIRGNYSFHNYLPQWSQGYNFVYTLSGQDILTEYNVIEGSSWPVQDLSGEFRYNVVVGYGHQWIRTVLDGATIHHNLFAPDGNGGLGHGIWGYLNWQYPKAKGIKIYNNTFDGGAKTGDFAGPFVGTSTPAVEIASLRNNLFTYARNTQNDSPGLPLVQVEAGSILYADYNAFYSPDSKQKTNYALTIAGKTPGGDGFGGHDVSGTGAVGVVDGRLAAHPFADQRWYPYTADKAAIWNRKLKPAQVMADFRARYSLPAGSPLLDKGDPADGKGSYIGAIGNGKDSPGDLFGR